jgi:acyl-CoA thioester hydrolase
MTDLSGHVVGQEHRFPVRVYWEDTDGSGIVYHARYLHFAERARTELLRFLGIHQQNMLQETGISFVLRRVTADYRAPSKLDDLLEVRTRATSLGAVTLEMEQGIWCDGRCLVVIEVLLVCVNRAGRPVRLPAAVKDAIDGAVGSAEAAANA